MNSAARRFGGYRFSTEDLPTRDRLEYFREVFARKVVRIDFEPIGDRPFRCDAILHALPNVALATLAVTPHSGVRTPDLISDGRNDIGLFIAMRGTTFVSHRGQDAVLRDGDAVLLRVSEISTLSSTSDIRSRCLTIPEAILAPMVQNTNSVPMTVVPAATKELRLLLGYIELLNRESDLATPAARHIVATHIHDLVTLVIGATRNSAAVAAGRGVRAARLSAIKADIAANLGRRDLSLEGVAGRQGISPSYVRKLFGDEGTTFSEFVLGQRLAKIRRVLTDPRFADQTISAIAFASGFGDLSYFNRTFRRQYNAAPSDIRRHAFGG